MHTCWIFDENPYLSVFRPGNLPRGVPKIDDCGGARRDHELKGETRGTQFDSFRLQRL
jgi:hypothetical protein